MISGMNGSMPGGNSGGSTSGSGGGGGGGGGGSGGSSGGGGGGSTSQVSGRTLLPLLLLLYTLNAISFTLTLRPFEGTATNSAVVKEMLERLGVPSAVPGVASHFRLCFSLTWALL